MRAFLAIVYCKPKPESWLNPPQASSELPIKVLRLRKTYSH